MAKILLIDVSHLFWSAWHASADKAIGFAFEETVGRVRKLAEGFEHVAVCCDSPPYKRKEHFADYKAQREAQPPAALQQFKRVRDRLAADGFLLWAAQGYEADDVIATACRIARSDEVFMGEVVIASADKDLLQLVDDDAGISVLSTRTGETLRAAEVMAKFDVAPHQMRDLLALMGDTSDNVPGVKGVGPKTAAKLLAEFTDIDNLLTRITYVEPPKLREKLFAEAENIRLSRKLVTLATDAPIDWEELFRERKPAPLVEDTVDYEDAEFEGEEPSEQEPEMGAAKEEPKQEEPRAKVIEMPKEQPKPTQAMVVHREPERGLQPVSIAGAFKLATGLYNSRLYSRFGNPEAIMAVIIRGSELGLGALTALDLFHVVEGRPVMHAHYIIARAKSHPDCEYFQFVGGDATFAEYETKHRRDPVPTRLKYTIQQAQAAGLVKPNSNWTKRPEEMLRKTCGVQLARIVFPEATAGLYAAEEMGADAA